MFSRTLDFSDEAYYLLLIRNPGQYGIAGDVSKFGYIYHISWSLSHSLLAVRISSLILTQYLAFVLLKNITQYYKMKSPNWALYLNSLAASTYLFYPYSFLPTPSYNTLALQGLILTMNSWFANNKKMKIPALTFGIFIVFLAKPPSGLVLLSLVIILYYFKFRKITDILNLLFIFILANSLFYILITGSVQSGINNDLKTLTLFQNLHADNTIKNIFLWDVRYSNQSLILFAFTLLVAFLICLNKKFATFKKLELSIIAILPVIGSIGTSNNIWFQANLYIYFLFVLLIYLTQEIDSKKIAKLIAVTSLIAILAMVQNGSISTYRDNNSIWHNTIEVEIPYFGKIAVSQKKYIFIQKMSQVIRENSSDGDKIIDLTGRLPIIGLISDRKAIGSPWTLGGYPGSTMHEIKSINSQICIKPFKLVFISSQDDSGVNLDKERILEYLKLDQSKLDRIAILDNLNWPEFGFASDLIIEKSQNNINCSNLKMISDN